jgi:hypothetical protein
MGAALEDFFDVHQAFLAKDLSKLVGMSHFCTFSYNENSGENKGLSFGALIHLI